MTDRRIRMTLLAALCLVWLTPTAEARALPEVGGEARLVHVKAHARTIQTATGPRTIQVRAHTRRLPTLPRALVPPPLAKVGAPARLPGKAGAIVAQPLVLPTLAARSTLLVRNPLLEATLAARSLARANVRPARDLARLALREARAETARAPRVEAAPAGEDALQTPAQQARSRKLALDAVRTALEPWVPKGSELVLRPAIVQFGGDLRNPITGSGPIEIHAETTLPANASGWARFKHAFDGNAHSKFYVQVDAEGRTQILGRESTTPQARLYQAISRVIPLRELVGDLFHSAGVRQALLAAGAALAAGSISPLLTGGGLTWAAKLAYDGIARRKAARHEALTSTLEMVAAERQRGAGYPTLLETYRYYTSTLENAKPGTTPWSIRAFSEKLSIYGL
jgi:hypothetical protein